eukprot:4927061-Pleurochrysis_carterae.AAC.1
MAGALDVSSTRDARPVEVKDDAHSGLLARVRGSRDPRAMRASQSSPVGGDRNRAESRSTVHGSFDLGMAGALDMSSYDDAQQPEIPVPETKDAGRMGAEEEAEVAGSETTPDLDEMKEACAELPWPEVYIRVALAVEEDGTAVLIISPSAIEGRAESESVESTPHSLAAPPLYDGPVWIEEMELLRDEAHLPETSLDVTIAVRNLPGNPLWQSKSTSQWRRANVGRGRGGTAIRRSVAENFDDLFYRPDAVRRLRRRDQVEGEGYLWAVYVRIEWNCMDGGAILHTEARVLPELDVPICIGESNYVQACCEAREREEEKAPEFMANAPPSLPPSPPPMYTGDEHDGPGGAGPGELPEGHELRQGKMLQK